MNTVDTKIASLPVPANQESLRLLSDRPGVMASRSAHRIELLVPPHHEPRGA